MSKQSLKDERWKRIAALVRDRDDHRCVSCGTEDDLTVDHIKALDLFDVEDWEAERQYDPNHLVTLCRPCNARKGNRLQVRVAWVNRRWLDSIPRPSRRPTEPAEDRAAVF